MTFKEEKLLTWYVKTWFLAWQENKSLIKEIAFFGNYRFLLGFFWMKMIYLIGQNNVGQKFPHLWKLSSLLSDEKFCPFSIFEISSKNSIHLFFESSPFLYHKNNKKKKKRNDSTYSTFQQLCSTQTHCPQPKVTFFHFWPDHFTIAFCGISSSGSWICGGFLFFFGFSTSLSSSSSFMSSIASSSWTSVLSSFLASKCQ